MYNDFHMEIIRRQAMFDALHPFENQILSVLAYKEYVALAGFQRSFDAHPARCPVCKHSMRDRAGGTKADDHFFHLEELFCPTKDVNARPYLGLRPRAANELETAANKRFVATHLDAIYSRMHEIVPFLDFKEFVLALTEATRLNAYGYAGLNPEHFPYVLVTMINFLPSKSFKKERKLKFVFFYDFRINSYEDLWIDRGFASDLTRISYDGTLTRRAQIVDTSVDYLESQPKYQLTDPMKKWCFDVMKFKI
jgi:hypothetical protein